MKTKPQPIKILITTSKQKAKMINDEIKQKVKKGVLELKSIPMIEITAPKKWDDFDNVVKKLELVSDIIITSQSAVSFFFQRLKKFEIRLKSLKNKRWFVSGELTKQKLQREFFGAVTQKLTTKQGLLVDIKPNELTNRIFWFPCSNLSSIDIATNLKKRGAVVYQTITYQNKLPQKSVNLLEEYLTQTKPDWIIFSSNSTFQNFISILEKNNLTLSECIKIAAIGEKTSKFINSYNKKTDLISNESNLLRLIYIILQR